jgi:tyrosine-protein kinase Etk/Wzc
VLMCEQLRQVGFSEVAMLEKPAAAGNATEIRPRVVAA